MKRNRSRSREPATIGQNVEIFIPLPPLNSKQRVQARREGRDLQFGETNSSPQRLTASERVRQYIQQPDPTAIIAQNLASSPQRSTGPSPSMKKINEQNRRRSRSGEPHTSPVKRSRGRPRSIERDDDDVPIKRARGRPRKDENLNVNSNNRSSSSFNTNIRNNRSQSRGPQPKLVPQDVPGYPQPQNTRPPSSRNGRLRSTEPPSYYESPEKVVHRGRTPNQDRPYLEGTRNYGNDSSTSRRSVEIITPRVGRRNENPPNQNYYNRPQRSREPTRERYSPAPSTSKSNQNRGQQPSAFQSNSRRSMERPQSPVQPPRRTPNRANTSNSNGRRSVDRQQIPHSASKQTPDPPRQQQASSAASNDLDINPPDPPPTPFRKKQNVPQSSFPQMNPGAPKNIMGSICLGLTITQIYGDPGAASYPFAPSIFVPHRIDTYYNFEASAVNSIVESFDKFNRERKQK